jgi:hypothetical protein
LLGTAKRDYKELSQLEKLTTGGIGAGVNTSEPLDGVGAPEIYLSISVGLSLSLPWGFRLGTRTIPAV